MCLYTRIKSRWHNLAPAFHTRFLFWQNQTCVCDISCPPQSRVYLCTVFWCSLWWCVSDGKTRHGVGHFIIANVISRSPLFPLPTLHKRALPDREKYNARAIFRFIFYLSVFRLRSPSLPRFFLLAAERKISPILSDFWFAFHFNFLSISCSLYYDFLLFLKIGEALWCWLNYYSALDQLNLSFWTPPANFCHSRRQMCIAEFIPPSPRAHWLPETQFLSPLKCCVQNGDSLHGKFAQLPAAYPLHKFKECFGVVLEGPFFLTSQPISLCFELR